MNKKQNMKNKAIDNQTNKIFYDGKIITQKEFIDISKQEKIKFEKELNSNNLIKCNIDKLDKKPIINKLSEYNKKLKDVKQEKEFIYISPLHNNKSIFNNPVFVDKEYIQKLKDIEIKKSKNFYGKIYTNRLKIQQEKIKREKELYNYDRNKKMFSEKELKLKEKNLKKLLRNKDIKTDKINLNLSDKSIKTYKGLPTELKAFKNEKEITTKLVNTSKFIECFEFKNATKTIVKTGNNYTISYLDNNFNFNVKLGMFKEWKLKRNIPIQIDDYCLINNNFQIVKKAISEKTIELKSISKKVKKYKSCRNKIKQFVICPSFIYANMVFYKNYINNNIKTIHKNKPVKIKGNTFLKYLKSNIDYIKENNLYTLDKRLKLEKMYYEIKKYGLLSVSYTVKPKIKLY